MVYVLYFVILVNIYAKAQAEIYASTAEVAYLIKTRQKVIHELQLYIDEEEKRLSEVKRYYELNKRENEKALKNVSNYISNPINGFMITKSLTVDLNRIEHLIIRGSEIAEEITLEHEGFRYPNEEDLNGTAMALSRLIKIYRLDVKEVAEGKLNNEQSSSSSPMSASDCFVLGRTLFEDNDDQMAVQWMEEAFRKYNEEKIPYPFTVINILEYISYGYYRLGDIVNAINWTQKILRIDPNQQKARHILSAYFRRIDRKRNRYEIEDKNTERIRSEQYKKQGVLSNDFIYNYEEMCRGELDVPIEISSRCSINYKKSTVPSTDEETLNIVLNSRLTCRYLNDRSPYLRIAPIKMETRYLNPEVVLFYNVVNDIEIDTMIKLALPKLSRAKVLKTHPSIGDDVRISKATWITDNETHILQRLSRRLAHITGLSLENSWDTQVGNYGLGGHFMPHYDPHDVTNETYTLFGRRIATAMIYLSDVAQGGATVFPRIGVRVTPLKGTALFWYNLHDSGEINEATLHAACPVLEGSKWVYTKWIFQAGQELHKPCGLQYQPQGYDTTVAPKPVPIIYRDRRLFENPVQLSSEAAGRRKAWFEDIIGTKNDSE